MRAPIYILSPFIIMGRVCHTRIRLGHPLLAPIIRLDHRLRPGSDPDDLMPSMKLWVQPYLSGPGLSGDCEHLSLGLSHLWISLAQFSVRALVRLAY